VSRLIFGIKEGLRPSEVITRDEVATAFGIAHEAITHKDGRATGYFYTDAPQGEFHDNALLERINAALDAPQLAKVAAGTLLESGREKLRS
jgi:hypothetical protein